MLRVLYIDLFLLDRFDDGLRDDAVLLVEGHLQFAPAFRLRDCLLHRVGHRVGVQDNLRVHVPCSTADDLDEAPGVAEEALLVRVQDPDEPHLGDVEPFPQEVDANEHIELAQAQLPDDLAPLQRLDLGVEVAGPDLFVGKELTEFLGQLLRERGDENTVAPGNRLLHLRDHVIGLAFNGPDLDLRVDKPGGPDDLLDCVAALFELILARRCRDEDDLPHILLELVELQRPVVVRAREPEAVVDERLLARLIAIVHPVELRDHLVALVDDHQEVVREIVEQAVGLLAGFSPVEVPRVVLDPLR